MIFIHRMSAIVSAREGVAPSFTPSVHLQADFYAKLSRLQNDVLLGKHPRFKLSKNALDILKPVQAQDVPISAPSIKQLNHTAHSENSSFVSQSFAPPLAQSAPSLKTQLSARYPPTAIDPVLLTKSDSLLRAELSLKRQRTERALKDACEARKNVKPPPRDSGAYDGAFPFDASLVLNAAQAIEKPLSGLISAHTDPPVSSSSSFDENSYYSSKVNSSWSSPEEGEVNPNKMDVDTTDNVKPASPNSINRAQIHAQTIVKQPVDWQNNRSIVKPSQYSGQAADAIGLPGLALAMPNVIDIAREESYSPPSADAFNYSRVDETQNTSFASTTNRVPPLSNTTSQPIQDRRTDTESYSPPSPAIPIVRKQFAPSPTQQSSQGSSSNMAPLPPQHIQMAQSISSNKQRKQQREKTRSSQTTVSTNGSQGHAARNGQILQNPKKRRREPEVSQSSPRRASDQQERRVVTAPMPYIKPEPMSPPPLTGNIVQDAPRRLILGDDGRANIQILSPRSMEHGPPSSRSNGFQQSALRNETSSRSVYSDAPSYLNDNLPIMSRNGRDLRRIASVQHASRPISPVEEIRYHRPMSRVISERPTTMQQPLYQDGFGQPMPQPRYIQQSASSPVYQVVDYETDDLSARRAMPPPPKKRIIVDENGDEWIAVPAASQARAPVMREIPYEEVGSSKNSMIREMPMQQPRMQRSRGYTQEPQYIQSSPQFVQRPTRYLQQPEVIDLEDEDFQRRRAYPQPIPRGYPPRARQEYMDPLPQTQPTYQVRQSSRATSMMPAVPVGNPYTTAFSPHVATREPIRMLDRSYSARPNVEQQGQMFQGRDEYDPRNPTLNVW